MAPERPAGDEVAFSAGRGRTRRTPASDSPGGPDAPEARPRVREGTRQAALIGMLSRPEGATIGESMAATGWLAHTVRGAIAGALKRRLGLRVNSEKVEGRGRVYRVG
jgi:Protein of unknown function (DUF3489)